MREMTSTEEPPRFVDQDLVGAWFREVNLVGARSYDEVIARIAAKARELPAGSWITGRGWDQNDWPDTRLPSHEALSRAVPNHPVAVVRVRGRIIAFANLWLVAGQEECGIDLMRFLDDAPPGTMDLP